MKHFTGYLSWLFGATVMYFTTNKSFFFLRQGLSMQSWLSWNCEVHQASLESTCFCLLNAGTKAMYQHAQFQANLKAHDNAWLLIFWVVNIKLYLLKWVSQFSSYLIASFRLASSLFCLTFGNKLSHPISLNTSAKLITPQDTFPRYRIFILFFHHS